MRKYRGRRRGVGDVVVTVFDENGLPSALDPRLDIFNHSPCGFEFGYSGSGPAQLALAILADHFTYCPVDMLRVPLDDSGPWRSQSHGDRAALGIHQAFKARAIAPLVGIDLFEMTSDTVSRFVAAIVEGGA